MLHLQIYAEIESKLTAMCDAALKEAGLTLLPAVTQIANGLTLLVNYKTPISTSEGS